MKKSLLFTAALASAVGLSANAQTMQVSASQNLTPIKAEKAAVAKTLKVTKQGFKALNGAKPQFKAEGGDLLYAIPGESFYMGLVQGSQQGNDGLYYPNATLVPAKADLLFKNLSANAETGSFEWEYMVYEGNQASTLTYEGKDFTFNSEGFAQYNYPILKDTQSGKTYEFGTWTSKQGPARGFYQTGGYAGITEQDGAFLGVQNWNFHTEEDENASLTIYPGVGASEDEIWTSILGESLHAVSFGAMYPAPATGYGVSSVVLNVIADGDLTKPLTFNVRKVEIQGDQAMVGDVIASGSATIAENGFPSFITGADITTIQINLQEKIGSTVANTYVNVDGPMYYEIVVPEGLTIEPIGFYSSNEEVSPLTYVAFDNGAMFSYNNLTKEDGGVCQGLLFAIDATFSWIKSLDGNEFQVPVEGGSKTFAMDALFVPNGWVISDSANALYDWIDEPTTSYDENTGDMSLTLTVQPLPSEIKSRHSFVKVASLGSFTEILVEQGDGSSVEGIDAGTTTVRVEGNNFVVNSDSATAVEIYNIAGQKVAAAAVNGETVVPAGDLANGVYVVKFDNNKVVKVLK